MSDQMPAEHTRDEIARLWDRLRIRTEEANRLGMECTSLRARLDSAEQALIDGDIDVKRLRAESTARARLATEWQLKNDALRAELATWQRRFGDCEATVLRMRGALSAIAYLAPYEFEANARDWAHAALDAVPRRAERDTVHSHIGTGWCDANGCTSPRIERPAASPEPTDV